MSSWTWSVPTVVVAGDEAINEAAVVTAGLGRRALVVSDHAVAAATLLVERWCSALAAAGVANTRLLIGEASISSVSDVVTAGARHGAQVVVAVGGGTVMDTAKSAALAARCPEVYLPGWENATGLVVPDPGRVQRPLPSVLCPTTVGTGSEVSPVACLTHAGRKKLVSHPLLRPSVAVLDPAATATTPRRVAVEGALEILLRCLGPALGTAPSTGISGAHGRFADTMALGLARQVLGDGDRVASAGGSVGGAERAARHRLALASAQTHTGWGTLGRDSWGHKLWYLAHEVAAVVGAPKVSATAALLPAFLDLVASGAWPEAGSPGRLSELTRHLSPLGRTSTPELVTGPLIGGEASRAAKTLLARWGLPFCLGDLGVQPAAVPHLVRCTEEAWGPPLPALRGIGSDGLTVLYTAALVGGGEPARRAFIEPQATTGKEVNYA